MSSLLRCKKNGQLLKLLSTLNNNLNKDSSKLILNHLMNQNSLNYFPNHLNNFVINRQYSASTQQNDFINNPDYFIKRHIGPTDKEKRAMLDTINYSSIEELISATIPKRIRLNRSLNLDEPLSETDLITKLKKTSSVNGHEWRSYIGMGYYNCITPPVIQRNIFENPG